MVLGQADEHQYRPAQNKVKIENPVNCHAEIAVFMLQISQNPMRSPLAICMA